MKKDFIKTAYFWSDTGQYECYISLYQDCDQNEADNIAQYKYDIFKENFPLLVEEDFIQMQFDKIRKK